MSKIDMKPIYESVFAARNAAFDTVCERLGATADNADDFIRLSVDGCSCDGLQRITDGATVWVAMDINKDTDGDKYEVVFSSHQGEFCPHVQERRVLI